MRLATLPRYHLTTLPTPLQRARNLEAALGPRCPRIYLKRDDLTGLAFGGNKVRKLEYLLADALSHQATVLVTEGAAQSNHARITAAAAVIAGLRSVLVLDARHGSEISGNLLLDHLLRAEVRIVPDKAARTALMASMGEELRAAGERPYMIPTGGSVPVGAAGYVAMVAELLAQLMSAGEAPSRLYFPTGSLGTQAGLVVGARAFSAPFVVYGVAVEHPVEQLVADGVVLANDTADLLGIGRQFTAADITIDGAFIGADYGVPTEQGTEAIRLLARTEAVFLDPVYSGKAMAALISHVRAGALDPNEAVIFLHTGGGPSLFATGTTLV
ncbi:MAG: 1-aminocyclopropane-carboxylate deaminase [Thermomicrobiales bacterium]|nr:1-aminocyclopropane-carboxylate deaminase [Thermomicrobiales bacterium]